MLVELESSDWPIRTIVYGLLIQDYISIAPKKEHTIWLIQHGNLLLHKIGKGVVAEAARMLQTAYLDWPPAKCNDNLKLIAAVKKKLKAAQRNKYPKTASTNPESAPSRPKPAPPY